MYYAWYTYSQLKSLKSYNEQVTDEIRVWNNAWINYERTVFQSAFQEEMQGEIGRIRHAALESINQVCDEEFKAPPVIKEDESTSMAELEQLVLKKKKDYK